MPGLSRVATNHEHRLRVLAALRELPDSQDCYFKPPHGMKAFARTVLQDVDISGRRVGLEIVDVMVEDRWIERQHRSGHFWRFGDQAPDPTDQAPHEEPADIANPIVTQLAEALESTLRLTAMQAVELGNTERLLELLNDLQPRLDPRIMSRVQLGVIEVMQATAKPAEA